MTQAKQPKKKYLDGIPQLPGELLAFLKRPRPITRRTEARLDREILILKTIIRAEREAYEAQTGQQVEVEPPLAPRPALFRTLRPPRQQTMQFDSGGTEKRNP